MEKLILHSPDLTDHNIERIAELFPTVITESQDQDGTIIRAVDFDLLRQELSDHVVEGPQERYQLDWPGKREALFAANAPISKTLRPVRKESVDFDTTRNLFIEGDNLDALKLLQESYLGKVKLIYIDPPYNTGRDFVYDDDFALTTADYLRRSAQKSELGYNLVANTEANGRFHSDWLSMMYPRLKLARNLLRADGAIYISIDDHEVANLRRLCDEVFGGSNFVATFIWHHRKSSQNDTDVSLSHNYTIVYARDRSVFRLNRLPIDQEKFENPDNDPRGPWVADPFDAPNVRPNLTYAIVNPITGEEHWPPNGRCWRFSTERFTDAMADGRVVFGKNGKGRPQLKRFLSEAMGKGKSPFTIWSHVDTATDATKELMELFDGKRPFDTPKPVGLLEEIIVLGSDPDSIVLDFFAGSGTTAHAVMRRNAADSGSRRWVLVQLSEPPAEGSDAAAMGYDTIAAVARDRIRRARTTVAIDDADLGFRALRVDTTSMADVLRRPDEVSQGDLGLYEAAVKPDRTVDDLLFQVMLAWGLELSLPISVERVDAGDAFVVDGGALIACFAPEVGPSTVRAIAARRPLRAVFRDSAFGTDAVRINAEQLFAELSAETSVRTI